VADDIPYKAESESVIINKTNYNLLDTHFKAPFWQFNGHIQTIYPSFFRNIRLPYERERLTLPDGDFIDLDWVKTGSRKLIIVTHGLEGDSTRHYVTGMIKCFVDDGFDGLGWNCRSCSGEINRNPRFYHHGDAGDLKYVIDYAIEEKKYQEVVLVGFSMGGSLTMRVLGENAGHLSSRVSKAVVASVPLDLHESVDELHKPGKRFYMKRFIRKLGIKLELKSKQFPDNPLFDVSGYKEEVKDFYDFDNRFTAPIHGYKNAIDFYKLAASKPLIKHINVPIKIVQALNDPFLSPECYNLGDGSANKNAELVLPEVGGHVGFMQAAKPLSFIEEYALNFYKS
jgi:predicted alpha/beta-fold hydrolase